MKYLTLLTLGVCLVFASEPTRKAPNVTITTPAGKTDSVAAHRGEVVLIQFLLTDCTHCQATARTFSKLQKEFPKKFHVMGVAFNESAVAQPSLIAHFIESNGVVFPVGSADRDTVLKHLNLSVMSRLSVPQIMLIGKDGAIRAQSNPLGTPELQDEASMRARIQKLLAE